MILKLNIDKKKRKKKVFSRFGNNFSVKITVPFYRNIPKNIYMDANFDKNCKNDWNLQTILPLVDMQ